VGEAIRLQKYLSMSGRSSRREAERMLLDGRVRVNGAVVRELGTRVDPARDVVEVDGLVVGPQEVRWVAFHKPAGVLTTRADPHGGATIYDVLPEAERSLKYVGRLDRDTEGLLLLTNAGDLIHALLHPSRAVEREYVATVARVPSSETLARLCSGVELGDGAARAKRVELVGREGGDGIVGLVLTEGRKREVRRLLESVGHPVRHLTRVRFGPVRLGTLPRGELRPLSDDEISVLRVMAGGT
jgi:23S rRNA pseudouridine2605 synthase